jgi:hypothetical protein
MLREYCGKCVNSGRRSPGGALRRLARATALATGIALVLAATPTMVRASSGWSGVIGPYGGPDGTSWSISYTVLTGTSSTCAPDALGNGWYCTARTPNEIDYSIRVDSSGVYLNEAAVTLFLGGTSFDGVQNFSCYGASSCDAPSNGSPQVYKTDLGGGWNVQAYYTYTLPGGVQQSYTSYPESIGSTPEILAPLQVPHPPPTVSLIAPTGVSAKLAPATGTPLTFTIRGVDTEGGNWSGEIQVMNSAGAVIDDDNLFSQYSLEGQLYKSGSLASSAPFTFNSTGNYTWRAQVTDTSGLPASESQSAWVYGAFSIN